MSWTNFTHAAERYCIARGVSAYDSVQIADQYGNVFYATRQEAVAREMEDLHLRLGALREAGML